MKTDEFPYKDFAPGRNLKVVRSFRSRTLTKVCRLCYPLPLASNRVQSPTWQTVLSRLQQLVNRQLGKGKASFTETSSNYRPCGKPGTSKGLKILSPNIAARDQLLVVGFHHDSMERCAGDVGLWAHCLFQFCAVLYVRCPSAQRKGITHVDN